jgi:DNA modification methylase
LAAVLQARTSRRETQEEKMNKIEFGDCRTIMRRWAYDGIKVQMCVTSPPYFGLRDYGHEGQIGLERRAPEYVSNLVEIFGCAYNLLADDGVLFVNIGDTYAGFKDGKFPPQSQSNGNQRGMPISGAPHRNKQLLKLDGFKNKELMGIPWRLAFAMQDAGWYLRQEIIWSKPNYTPEKVRDRFIKSHEHIFLFTKKDTYFFNGDAVRVSSSDGKHKLRPSVWSVPVSTYKGAHFATFPPALIEPCVQAGSREGDIVLDPFIGSGTTAEVALRHGRRFLGCELNPEYKQLQDERIESAKTLFTQ